MKYQDNQAHKVALESSSERNAQALEHKRNNTEKFRTVTEMRKHLNAFKTLHAAGYNAHSLREIANEFHNSKEHAMKEIYDMSGEMERLTNS